MVSWMYEGLQEENSLEKAGWLISHMGSMEDKANLKSSCELKDAIGNTIDPELVTPDGASAFPMYIFYDIPDDCSIHWQAQTEVCDDQPGSDRVEVELVMGVDYILLAQISNDILATWQPAEVEALLDEFSGLSIITTYQDRFEVELSAKIDNNEELGALLMPTVFSDVIQSDAQGNATGIIQMPDFWPKGEYYLNIHYGYSARSEGSQSSKFWQFMKEWGITILEIIILLVLIIIFVATMVASGGTAGVAWASAIALIPTGVMTGLFVADLGLMAHDYLATGFGMIDENEAGCLFPLPGFNHMYGFSYLTEETIQDSASNLDITIPKETEELFENWLKEGDFWPKVLVLGAFGSIIIASLKAVI